MCYLTPWSSPLRKCSLANRNNNSCNSSRAQQWPAQISLVISSNAARSSRPYAARSYVSSNPSSTATRASVKECRLLTAVTSRRTQSWASCNLWPWKASSASDLRQDSALLSHCLSSAATLKTHKIKQPNSDTKWTHLCTHLQRWLGVPYRTYKCNLWVGILLSIKINSKWAIWSVASVYHQIQQINKKINAKAASHSILRSA